MTLVCERGRVVYRLWVVETKTTRMQIMGMIGMNYDYDYDYDDGNFYFGLSD